MALLDGDLPVDELPQAWQVGTLVHCAYDRPVADFAGLGHCQELEAVERVRVVAQVGRHHLRRFLLRLARLLQDRRLLAVEILGEARRPLLRLLRLLVHLLERLLQVIVLALLRDELPDLPSRTLGRHRESENFADLAFESCQLRHRLPPRGMWKGWACLPRVAPRRLAPTSSCRPGPRPAKRRSFRRDSRSAA